MTITGALNQARDTYEHDISAKHRRYSASFTYASGEIDKLTAKQFQSKNIREIEMTALWITIDY